VPELEKDDEGAMPECL